VIQGLTFDFWNTLVAEGASAGARSRRWKVLLADSGHDVDQATLERAFTDLWSWFTGRWEGNLVVTPEDAARQALELMHIDGDDELLAQMVATLHDGTDPAEITIAPGLGDALERLRSDGVRLGIICDVGMTPSSTLRRYLDHHGMLAYFYGWAFSDDVGCYKPDRRMFDHAAGALGLEPGSTSAHIGDLRRTDVAGARAAGWVSLRYRGFFDDGADLPDADHVVDSHLDLPELLASHR
jgi:FMN phosphatase YigB (HAD superfamily)